MTDREDKTKMMMIEKIEREYWIEKMTIEERNRIERKMTEREILKEEAREMNQRSRRPLSERRKNVRLMSQRNQAHPSDNLTPGSEINSVNNII